MVCPWMMMFYGDGTGTGNKIWSWNHQFVSHDEGKEVSRYLISLSFCPIFFKLQLNYFRPQYVFENLYHFYKSVGCCCCLSQNNCCCISTCSRSSETGLGLSMYLRICINFKKYQLLLLPESEYLLLHFYMQSQL